jgi:hypothetical protein
LEMESKQTAWDSHQLAAWTAAFFSNWRRRNTTPSVPM